MGVALLKRMRPDFGLDKLMLSRQTGETSYLPAEYTPHTCKATLAKSKELGMTCILGFEYSIDEDLGPAKTEDPGVIIMKGKYSHKIICIQLAYKSLADLTNVTARAISRLTSMAIYADKESHQRNIDLVRELIERFHTDLVSNVEMQRLVMSFCDGPATD